MITQEDANGVCNLMYRMRDAIGDNNTRRALELCKELYETLLKMTVNHEQLKCILDCTIKDKEQ